MTEPTKSHSNQTPGGHPARKFRRPAGRGRGRYRYVSATVARKLRDLAKTGFRACPGLVMRNQPAMLRTTPDPVTGRPGILEVIVVDRAGELLWIPRCSGPWPTFSRRTSFLEARPKQANLTREGPP